MDYILLTVSVILIVLGLLGCFLPVIPGPPFSFLGLLAIEFTRFVDFSTNFLIFMAVIAIVVTILDYVVPIWGTKKFGGTKAGMWGATIGLIVGMIFLGPFGMILGPLFGAIIGELIQGTKSNEAMKAGLGAFIGFLLGIGLKLAASFYMTFHFIKAFF
ncbi:MAG: hypothetical protein A2X13_00540 [Bacteroidetes bacterium GWC2_33_15]|nr:MAG: hypothetical protein A2X10_04350 [Bacteroidetes bacterium GWA2_33_15]OFX51107.1 MAG: hypothetical protein A2X13_00540 [Bacteroidetes bacterium GWC2_33_15]OFX66459.1 MAG: hypothetical protein A2X15_07415 [Bacteroidetes bacterium GWB2_32_14]OFX70315.1 MAG: hypothetical protein A2X14_03430 [Bacteroidetes bacterium GWD2_33_33]HAN17317.1 DUF456 domain-containing protein [Bacteroidales bacterium]